jgi:hypothetical protein
MPDNEFYIGWMPQSSSATARFARKVTIVLVLFIACTAIVVATLQKQFSTAVFEYGKPIHIKGVFFEKPFPAVKIITGRDFFGNASIMTVPLVGYGKHGAGGMMKELGRRKGIDLNHKEINLLGTLIYSQGRTLLQVDQSDSAVSEFTDCRNLSAYSKEPKEGGLQTLKGEIIDPKCYFGVMKPGEGKAHRDCAIRCILGGIPPMLLVRGSNGESRYYIISAESTEATGKAVQDFVGEPAMIQGRVIEYDDWTMLYIDAKTAVRAITRRDLTRDGLATVTCAVDCLQ